MTPKLTEKTKFYSFKRQSSFGIRKFTIGVVSVSLGTALVATAPAASADTLEPASSALAAPSTEVSSQTADKAALAQALSEAQAIDLSQQAPEVAEAFVELFARASALFERAGVEQAELDALTQELQHATQALTTELPTAVGTPVEVADADADAVLPSVSEEEESSEVAVLENPVTFSVSPATLYPSYATDTTGGMVEILDVDGNRMPEYGTLDGGSGFYIKRNIRLTVPEGGIAPSVRINLGQGLTFRFENRVVSVTEVASGGYKPSAEELQNIVSGNLTDEVIYRPISQDRIIDLRVIFHVSNREGIRGFAQENSTYYQEQLANGEANSIVKTLPFLVTYNYVQNGRNHELKAGINSVAFPNALMPIPEQELVDAGFLPYPLKRTNNLLTSVGVKPILADVFGSLYPDGTRFEWGSNDSDVKPYSHMPYMVGGFSEPHRRNNFTKSFPYVAILPDGTRIARLFPNVQVTDTKALEVNLNEEPDAQKMLKDSGGVMPFAMASEIDTFASWRYEWTIKPDTSTPGHKTGVVTVKTPKGYSSEYWVTVTVVDTRKASDIHVPTIAEQRVAIGASVDPRQVISNLNELPATIGVEWVTQPVTTLAQWEQNRGKATPTYELKVTYPDGSFDTVQVPVRIWAQADEKMYTSSMPLPNFTTTTTLGVLPPIEKFFGYETPIIPNGELAGARLEWGRRPTVDASEYALPDSSHPDYAVKLMTRGTQTFGVRLIFVDGSSLNYVTNPIMIHYVDNATYFTPTTSVQEVDFGAIVDPVLSIANRADLPVETSYRWKGLVNTGLAGAVNAVVVVTYPDKSSEEVTVVVRVLANQASLYTPTAVLGGLTLGINDPIDPAQLIGNRADLPSDARFEFVEPVGDPLSGTSKIVSVRITFSDGSVKTVRSRLKFRATQAQESIPEVQSLRVSQGSSIRPIDFIKNASSLPANTRYSWSQEPSTRVPGGRVGQILVTYPDGSTEIITVRFTVR